jgi:hypothetical protein
MKLEISNLVDFGMFICLFFLGITAFLLSIGYIVDVVFKNTKIPATKTLVIDNSNPFKDFE